jgi:hypothetical protein
MLADERDLLERAWGGKGRWRRLRVAGGAVEAEGADGARS